MALPLPSKPTVQYLLNIFDCTDSNQRLFAGKQQNGKIYMAISVFRVFKLLIEELNIVTVMDGNIILKKDFITQNRHRCTIYFDVNKSSSGSLYYKDHTSGISGTIDGIYKGIRFLLKNPFKGRFCTPKNAIWIINKCVGGTHSHWNYDVNCTDNDAYENSKSYNFTTDEEQSDIDASSDDEQINKAPTPNIAYSKSASVAFFDQTHIETPITPE